QIQAQQAVEVARAALAPFVGVAPEQIHAVANEFAKLPPAPNATTPNQSTHPVAQEQAATVEQARAQLRVLERSYFPRFYLQGSAYARGTGAELNGSLEGGLNGLAPNVQNYALGFTVTFPLSNAPAIHAQEAAQAATVRAQSAKQEQIALELRARWN